MTGPEIIANLQEEPAGKPWAREWVRDWEPAPFDPVKYEEFAKEEAGTRPRSFPPPKLSFSRIQDPLL